MSGASAPAPGPRPRREGREPDGQPGPYLDPAALARIKSLEVVARTLVEGFIKGLHFSARKGSSTEFAEHRPYVPGDELRHLDWKAYGKTDRLYLREYEDETNLRATLVLDVSRSMAGPGGGVSKLRYGACLAAAVGHLLLGQRDAVGLALVGEKLERHVPPKATARHLKGLVALLEAVEPSGRTRLGPSLDAALARASPKGLIIVISDFLDDPAEILKAAAHVAHRGSDLLLLHLLDPVEAAFPFSGWTVFRDPEEPSRLLRLDAREVREIYRENLEAHIGTLRDGAAALGVDYSLVSTSEPFELALAAALLVRSKRRR